MSISQHHFHDLSYIVHMCVLRIQSPPFLYTHLPNTFTGMFTENNDGKLLPLKTDHDVLNLKERDIVTVEIKD